MKTSIWKPFFHLLHRAKLPYSYIMLYTLLSVLGSQLYLLFPSYTQQIMKGDISQPLILMVIGIVFGSALITSVNQFVLSIASAKITLRLRETAWAQVVRLPVSFYEGQPASGLISRVTQDTAKLGDLAATLPGNVSSSVYTFTGSFLILFSYHWKLAALEALMIPLLGFLGIWQGRVQFSWNQKIQEKTARLTGHLSEILLNLPLVKSFCAENHEKKRGKFWIGQLFRVRFLSSLINNLLLQLKNFASVLHIAVMITLGLWMISKNEITIDVWVAFYMYSQGLLNSFSRIMSIWGNVKSSQGAMQRITEMMQEPTEQLEEGQPDAIHGDIAFTNVSFSYGNVHVLNHLTFTIPEGKTTALIGSSGAGKTTIFQLLERFYAPDSGTIQMGGVNIRHIPLESWRHLIGYAAQSPYLFSGTIRENILYGIHRAVTERELQQALDLSQCTEFVADLPDGLETQIGENGGKLSGGQRQRISIARILLQKPKILLLDEVSANLDMKSQYLVEQALANLRKGRTSVVIAHRMSAIKNADQIVVLEDGAVNDIGVHSSLKSRNPLYRRFLHLQEQYIEEVNLL